MNTFHRAFCVAAVAVCAVMPTAKASVVIAGTRVIFDAAQGETTVRLTNDNDRPALVEAWIDAGDIAATPDTAHTPFLLTPPIFRMDAHKEQSLRILYVQGAKPLPSDRESVFWLDVLEVPPKPSGPEYAGKNYMQFSVRTRIKLFYRPAKLPGDPLKAPQQLAFRIAPGKEPALEIRNPTPYYITIGSVTLGNDSNPVKDASGMVAPFGDLRLPLHDVTRTPAPGTPIRFTTINDYGAGDAHQGAIAQ